MEAPSNRLVKLYFQKLNLTPPGTSATMDDLLPQLLAFPPHPAPQTPLSDSSYDEGIKLQIAGCRQISDKNLLQLTSGGESPLDVS